MIELPASAHCAFVTSEQRLESDEVARSEAAHSLTQLNDPPDTFVAENAAIRTDVERCRTDDVPGLWVRSSNMKVGAADSGKLHPNPDVSGLKRTERTRLDGQLRPAVQLVRTGTRDIRLGPTLCVENDR